MTAFNLQGFNITAWSKSGFADYSLNATALQYIKNEGSNLVAIDYAVNFNNNGSIIDPNSSASMAPSTKDLAHVIDLAHQLGLQVILKPHITLATSAANVNDGNTSTSTFLASNFFPAWNGYLNSLGSLAQAHGVEGIAIGTEFNIYDSTNRAQWLDIISSLRGIYSGQLTYDALFSVFTDYDSTAKVCFWDKLDYISCSLYVPLSSNDAAPQSQLVGAFLNNPYGSVGNVVSYLANISAKYGKQIMALEGGYQSVAGALDLANLNTLPNSSQTISNSTQANGLNAYLYALESYGASWLKGVSLWQVTPENMTTKDLASIWHTNEFTSYQKPSAQIIADYFQGKTTYLNKFTVAANGQKFYGGILNNSYEIVRSESQPVTLSFYLTGTIVNGKAPTIELYIGGNRVDTFNLNTKSSSYTDGKGINWDMGQTYSMQYTGALNNIQLVFKSNSSNGLNEGSYLHGFSIDGLAQDLTKTITYSSGSAIKTNSMSYGTTSTLDIANRVNSINSGTEIHGGPGVDQAIFSSASKNYQINIAGSSTLTVSSSTGALSSAIKCSNVERLQFTDTTIALDIGKDQTAGSGYMLYKAAFNRTPDASGLGYWISKMDSGMSYSDVAKNFVTSAEFKTAFGGSNPSVNTLVTKLYNNVLNRTPDAGGLAFWQDKLNTGWSTADVLGFFSTSGENVTNVTPLIANGISYTQFVG